MNSPTRRKTTFRASFVVVCCCSSLFLALVLILRAPRVKDLLWRSSQQALDTTAIPAVTLLQADCQCRSLFSLNNCGNDHHQTNEANIPLISKALADLRLAKIGRPRSIHENLHAFSRILPNVFNIHDRTEDPLKLTRYLTYVPCHIHRYTKEGIHECIARRKKVFRRPLRLAFLGDSHVRNLMEKIVVNLGKDFPIKIIDPERRISSLENYLGHKVERSIKLISQNIQLDFHWAPFFYNNPGVRPWDTFHDTLADGPPDLVYFDIGNWPLLQNFDVGVLAEIISELKRMRNYLKELSKSSVVLIRSPTPMKEWLHYYPDNYASFARDEIGKLEHMILNSTGVMVWDTVTPVHLKEVDQCQEFWKAGFTNLTETWKCDDRGHVSHISDGLGSNMIWNLFCNKVMETEQGHCCT